jgi:hypothetical protein
MLNELVLGMFWLDMRDQRTHSKREAMEVDIDLRVPIASSIGFKALRKYSLSVRWHKDIKNL